MDVPAVVLVAASVVSEAEVEVVAVLVMVIAEAKF